jgi:hypothetical protein
MATAASWTRTNHLAPAVEGSGDGYKMTLLRNPIASVTHYLPAGFCVSSGMD